MPSKFTNIFLHFAATPNHALQPTGVGSLGVATRIVKTCLTTFILSGLLLHGSLADEGLSIERLITHCERQIVEHPEDPKLLLELAELQMLARQREAALNSAQRALERAPNDVGFLAGLANVYCFLGRDQQAIELLLRVIRLAPTIADHHFNLAIIYATQRPPNRKGAQTQYSQALALGAEPDSKLEELIK